MKHRFLLPLLTALLALASACTTPRPCDHCALAQRQQAQAEREQAHRLSENGKDRARQRLNKHTDNEGVASKTTED